MIQERLLEKAACSIVYLGNKYPLSFQQEEGLRQVVRQVIAGKKFTVSDQIGIFHGFDRNYQGLAELAQSFQDNGYKRSLFLTNHFTDCPLKIVGNAMVAVHALHENLGIEPKIVFGLSLSPLALLRGRINQTTNIVLTGGRGGRSKEIIGLLDKGESVLIYPEGTNSTYLKKGDFRSGIIAYRAALSGVPVAGVSIYFEKNEFFVSGQILEKEKLIELGATFGKSKAEKRTAGQRAVDYALGEIASLLPEKLQGFYSKQDKV